jgi:hypothetical protein
VGSPLEDAVSDFVTEVGDALAAVMAAAGTGSPEVARRDATVEAFSVVVGVIDADGRLADRQLWDLIVVFAPRMDTRLGGATPEKVRAAGLVSGKARWLETPSEMFRTFAAVDTRRGTTYARTYLNRAWRLGLATAAMDDYTSRTELAAVEAFRATLMAALPAGPGGSPPTGTTAAAAGAGAAGVSADEPAAEPEPEPVRPLEELLEELDGLVGLDPVKAEVRLVANLLQVQRLRTERGLPVLTTSRHLVFTGNPGTGKTTVARLLGQIYRTLGVVGGGQLVETDRAGLVAGYVGQTAAKVTAAFDRAEGGVLLVDEAYALARGGERDFGREAIDTMVKLIEDRRDSVVVIVAGYPDEMADFVGSNPGLRSRFPKTIFFPDYTDAELVRIFELLGERNRYRADEAARAAVVSFLAAQPRDKGFGNARLVRNLFEAAVANHATRVVTIAEPSDEELTTLTRADIPSTVAST